MGNGMGTNMGPAAGPAMNMGAPSGSTPTGSTSAGDSDVRSVVEGYKAAFLRNDLDGVFSYFADDVIADDLGVTVMGKQALMDQTMKDYQQFPGLTFSFGDTTYMMDTAMHVITVQADPIHAMGLDRILIEETLVVSQGKIVSFTDVLDRSDPQTARFAQMMGGQ
jgi:hypothetical protein